MVLDCRKERKTMAKIVVTIDRETCKGCGLCVSVCPRQILAIDRECVNGKGYYPAAVGAGECIGCISCARMCPEAAIRIEKTDREG